MVLSGTTQEYFSSHFYGNHMKNKKIVLFLHRSHVVCVRASLSWCGNQEQLKSVLHRLVEKSPGAKSHNNQPDASDINPP